MVKIMVKSLVCGVGLNDADYFVKPMVSGKRAICPFYRTWKSMLVRCYDAKCQSRQPTYIGCTVAHEWLTFSNFKRWMEQQDWQGKELDKDLLFNGNKIYSPETCAFVDVMTNLFTNDCRASRGEWPVGVSFNKHSGKLQARCNNPLAKKLEYIGYFSCQNQAHQAWRKRKHELACQLADLQTDQRVADALRSRYQ